MVHCFKMSPGVEKKGKCEGMKGSMKKEGKKPSMDKCFLIILRVSPTGTAQHTDPMTYLPEGLGPFGEGNLGETDRKDGFYSL